MANTTFSGPVRAGTIVDTTGTTLGTNVKNIGPVVLTQSSTVALTQATTAATALGIIIPANSQILSVVIMIEQLFANSATTTIAVGKSAADATDLIAPASVSGTATIVNPTVPASAGAWRTVGTSDVQLYGIVVANSATAGKARIVVTYSQNAALAAL
jgi:hypothetical protein